MKRNNLLKLVSVCIFLLLFSFFRTRIHLPWFFAAIISLIITEILKPTLRSIIIPRKKRTKQNTYSRSRPSSRSSSNDERNIEKEFKDIKDDRLRNILIDGSKKKLKLERIYVNISNIEVRNKVREILKITKKIFSELKKDPKDANKCRQFLNYYLDAAITIIEKYNDLSSKGSYSPEIQDTLYKAEKVLDVIIEAFNKQLAKLYDNEVMDLNLEIEVLEKTLLSEGFSNKVEN